MKKIEINTEEEIERVLSESIADIDSLKDAQIVSH